jgi:hypothetical protein
MKTGRLVVLSFVLFLAGVCTGIGVGLMASQASKPAGFSCPAGLEPELLWSGDVVTVTGKCEAPAIRYIPPVKP